MQVVWVRRPEFMWSYHYGASLSVLLVDTVTDALRTIHIRDREEFFDHSKTEEELDEVLQSYIDATVAKNATENETLVDVVKFAMDENTAMTLKCPKCSVLLYWKSTGIS